MHGKISDECRPSDRKLQSPALYALQVALTQALRLIAAQLCPGYSAYHVIGQDIPVSQVRAAYDTEIATTLDHSSCDVS
jgi:hypothetical protein